MPDTSLQLDADVLRDCERILVQRLEAAVAGASQRDADLAEFDDQLEGRLYPTSLPWPNASTTNDPLSREAHLQLLSLLMQAFKGSEPWTVEAVQASDTDTATLLEGFLADRFATDQLDQVGYDLAYNAAGRDDTAILYVGWQQRLRDARETLYRDVDEDDETALTLPHERDPEKEYEPVEVTREGDVEHDGCLYRAIDLADFYLYPATAPTIERAQGVAERMLLTEDELLDGIDDYGWDEDKVLELIRKGPTHGQDADGDLREREDSDKGLRGEVATREDGYYECFLWFGRLPKCRAADGEMRISPDLARGDVMGMICPDHASVFHLCRSPYCDRPYLAFGLLPKPRRFVGTGGMRLLKDLQDEANALMQSGLDSIAMKMVPTFAASVDWLASFGNRFQFFPGAIFPRETPEDFTPLQVGGDVQIGFEAQAQLVGRGKGLIAAEGYGQLDNKVRKSGEMQNVLQATDAKFDLFLTNFLRGWTQLGQRILALYAQFGGEQGNWTFTQGKDTKEVTAEDLRGQFKVRSSANAATASPDMRLNIAEKIQGVTVQYWTQALQSPPAVVKYLWHTTRDVLMRLDVRSPESCIGPDPSVDGNAMQQLQLSQQIMALVKGGMSVEQAIGTIQQQMAGGAPTPPQNGLPQLSPLQGPGPGQAGGIANAA